jgi:hypothetical protein
VSRDSVAVPPSHHQVGAAALVTRDWDAIRSELLRMAEDDRALRAKLARDGSLFRGYHPAMRALHDRNAERLGVVLEHHGWPGRSQVGEPAAHAAWLVLQHAIGHPPLMRRGLALLREASARGDAAALEVAMLEDRIRTFEGRPQRYATQFDWDEQGELSPHAIEDAGHVDERRRALGLAPLAEDLRRRREAIRAGPERPPTDRAAWQREREAWLREVGWR